MDIATLLRRALPHEELGWEEIGEEFTRFTLLKTPWFRVYLHRLYSPAWHPQGHDHPWDFIAVLLRKGYIERTDDGDFERRPGNVLVRPAEFTHNVATRKGEVAWSIIVTGPKRREWQFRDISQKEGLGPTLVV